MRELLRIFYGALSASVRQHLCRIGSVVIGASLLSACSLSVPMPGLGSDEASTGSIKPAVVSPFSAEMDAEDWRRAKSALDTALDPQGNGAKVAWDNPTSGAKGSFVPLAQPFPKDDGICRAFTALVEIQGKGTRASRSSACRRNGGEWIVGQVKPIIEKFAVATPKARNLAERDTGTQLK